MWPTGLSWTKGFDVMKGNPNGIMFHAVGYSGPFLFERIPVGKKFLEFYIGFKPTPGFDPIYDGSWLVRFLAKYLHIGYSNFGMALRIVSQ